MKRIKGPSAAGFAALLALSGCAPPVLAPTVPVMPGPNKPFDQFAADQAMCQQYANSQTAPLAAQANNQAFGSAILGTALGAGLGAAVGGGRGAAIGAASGAVLGTGVGANQSAMAGMSLQQQYDVYYAQCMYARGNQVPGFSPPPYSPTPYSGPGAPLPPPLR